jgi:putative ABC transport system permease protein
LTTPLPRPPRLAALLVRLTAGARLSESQLGDLLEEFLDLGERDAAEARRWYWRQALGSVGPNLSRRIRPLERNPGRGDGTVRTLIQAFEQALRSAVRHPSFTFAVVLTLGLGIGANTTVFSAVYGLVLHPFPFPEPDRIVGVGTAHPRLGSELTFFEHLSPAEYLDVQNDVATLEHVVAWDMGNRQIAGEGPPQNVFTGFWWGDALRTLGMDAHLGRGFTDEESRTGAPVAILSYRIWRERFGADSSMVGSAILVNEAPHTLVGILPEGVAIYGTDLWTTMPVGPEVFPRNRRQFQILARVADGATLADVNAELEGLARRTEQTYGGELEEYAGWSMQAVRWNEVSSRPIRAGAFAILGAVAFVLLLVCANVANLLLARAQGRRQEMAVRTSLGAGRGRLVTQLLAESLVLGSLGGVVGVGLAALGVAGVRSLIATLSLPLAGSVRINGAALLFTAAVSVACGVSFGLAPALQLAGRRVSAVLQAEGKSATAGRSRQALQRSFVAIEVALAFVLVASAGLLINSYVRLNRVATGFAHEELLSMRLTLPWERYQGEALTTFFRQLGERVAVLPGVRAAAAASQLPPNGFQFGELVVDGAPPRGENDPPLRPLVTMVTADYFRTLGLPVESGRVFEAGDRAGTPLVTVINQAAAQRYFPGADPVGRRVRGADSGPDDPWLEIVGVVGSTQNRGLDRPPEPEVYALHEQIGQGNNQLFLVVRAEGDPSALLPAVREVVREMDPDQPIYAIQTVAEAFHASASTRRATTLLLTLFGGFALLLAAVGIYAVVSFTVSQRTREIGLRVALGADAARVRRLVVRQTLAPVLLGALAGLGLTIPLGAGLREMLFEVSSSDPATLAAGAALLVAVAVAASVVPARRAGRLEPVEALRVD